MMKKEEVQKIISIAKQYYEENLTQEEISRITGISRPTISRILKKALAENYVQIQVINPFEEKKRLSEELKNKLGLDHVIVISGQYSNPELLRRALALSAADYISSIIEPNDIVGIGWGRTLNRTSEIIEPDGNANNVVFLPLLGGIGQVDPSFQVHNITRSFSKAFNGKLLQYHIPGIVNDKELREKLLQTKNAKEITSYWTKLDKAIIGLGEAPLEEDVLTSTYFSNEEKEDLVKNGAIGDICMRFYNISGKQVNYLNQEIMSIDLNSLQRIPEVIAIAGGIKKTDAIIGASNGKYIKTLITDEPTALNILEKVNNAKNI
jgi:DNA-binding transcriptional regulator LsrR (DeoR family)